MLAHQVRESVGGRFIEFMQKIGVGPYICHTYGYSRMDTWVKEKTSGASDSFIEKHLLSSRSELPLTLLSRHSQAFAKYLN